jgi:hypothetical protein
MGFEAIANDADSTGNPQIPPAGAAKASVARGGRAGGLDEVLGLNMLLAARVSR